MDIIRLCAWGYAALLGIGFALCSCAALLGQGHVHRTLRLAGQKPGGGTNDFAKPKETLKRAFDWLHGFWAARLPQEKALLGPAAKF